MPVIQPYEERVQAQGQISGQASPDDFGGQIGVGMQRLGGAIGDVGDAIYRVAEAKDVTSQHVNFAKARAEWQRQLTDDANKATAGDDTFAPTFRAKVDQWLVTGEDSAATPAGKRLYKTLGANMASEMEQSANRIQGELAATEARNQHAALEQYSTKAVFDNEGMRDSTLAAVKEAIYDPKSMYAKVPSTMRDEFLRDIQNKIDYATSSGIVERHPEFALGSFAPQDLALFDAWKGLIQANTAPGGKVNLKPETVAQAPEYSAVAAANGVNPNILMAQHDIDTEKREPAAQAAMMGQLLDRYAGDYTKALAAYDMGTEKFDGLVQLHQSDWQANLPQETQSYVNGVMSYSGAVAAPAIPGEEPEKAALPANHAPVGSSIPAFNGLTWQQQSKLAGDAVQTMNLRKSMALQARQEAEYQQGEQQKATMDGMLQKIVDPKQFGKLTETEILQDRTLDWNQKQHMVDYRHSRQREQMANAETRTNPTEFKRLLVGIYEGTAYDLAPVMESYKAGRISSGEMFTLRREVAQLQDSGGNNFQKSVQNASNVVHDTFTRSIEGSLMPGVAAEGWYRFKFDMDQQIQAKRDKGEDPRGLLDPGSKDYLLKPERLQSFMDGAKGAVNQAAGVTVSQYNQAQQSTSMKEGTVSASGKFVWQGGKWVAR